MLEISVVGLEVVPTAAAVAVDMVSKATSQTR
jgi:hypothetical protein